MRHYRLNSNAGAKKRRRSWSGSKFQAQRKKRFRQQESAAFLGYSNTLYNSSRNNPLRLKSLLLGLVTLSWIGFLFYSAYFRISQITYSGYNLVNIDEIKNLVNPILERNKLIIPGNHYLVVNVSEIEEKLTSNLPISSAVVKKIFPNSLSVQIVERNSSIILDNGESYQLLDKEGKMIKYLGKITENYIFSTSSTSTPATTSTPILKPHIPNKQDVDKEQRNLPIIFINSSISEPGDYLVDPNIIKAINDFDEGIKKGGGISINYYKPDFSELDIIAVTNQGWTIKFTTERPINNQLNAFWSMFRAASPKEYIDVRLEDRLFWK